MKLLTVLMEAIDMVRLPNGADSCSLCIYELKWGEKKTRRLGSRGREGRVPGMTASEWGLGVGVRERRRAEAKTEPNHEANKEGRLCLGQRMVLQAWGKKSYHR